jgi:integrase
MLASSSFVAMPRKPKPKPLAYGDGSVTQRKSTGRYIVRVRDNGVYKHIGSSMDQEEARRILDRYNADRQAGINPDGRDWLTVDWLDHWLSTQEPRYDPRGVRINGVEPTTFEKYETQIRRHIVPYIGDGKTLASRVVDVQPAQVDRWQQQLHDAGLGANVQREALQRLSGALDLALDYDYIQRNPAARARRNQPKLVKPRHVKPSELDLRRLLRAIRKQPLEALVWIAMGAGLRRNEVAGLHWEDIVTWSDEHGEIRACRRRNRLGKRAQERLGLDSGDLVRDGLKTQDQRVVPIASLVIGILRERWQHQLREWADAGARWKGPVLDPSQPHGFVFTSEIGTPLEVDKISDFMANVRDSACLDIQRFHALRRAFTTLCNKAGVPDRVTQEMVGHADLEMTRYYQDPMVSQMQEAAQLVDAELRRLIEDAG